MIPFLKLLDDFHPLLFDFIFNKLLFFAMKTLRTSIRENKEKNHEDAEQY